MWNILLLDKYLIMGGVNVENENIQALEKVKDRDNVRFTSNMILYLMGSFVSLFGTQIYNFAIALYVLKETGSGLAFSATLVFSMLPRIILGPIAGVLADRVDRKKVVVGADIASGLVVFAFFGAVTLDGFKLAYVYGAAVLLAVSNTFFDTFFGASIPNIVDDKHLMRLNSLSQSIRSIASIAGPFLGGLIYGFVDIRFFLVFNAVSFILSGIQEMFIDFEYNKPEMSEAPSDIKEKGSLIRDFVDGFKYIKSQRAVFIMFCFAVFLNFFFAMGLEVPLPYIVNNELQMSANQFGILEGMFPVGMLVGSLVLSIIPEREKKYRSMILGLLVCSLVIIMFGMPIFNGILGLTNIFWFVYYNALIIIIGIALIFVNVPISVMMQRLVPDNMRGRVFGLMGTMAMAISPVGMILSGVFLDMVPAFIMPVATGLILVVLTLMMAGNRDIQRL